ncbi:MAG: hypothetical protein H0U57_01955 [Tatlockia sp.]|nr:hypothetical protein [Tatlockia sp.]
MTLPFFNESRKSESESTGVGFDALHEFLTRPIGKLRTQASKMQAVRPTNETASCIETLKNLNEEINHIAEDQYVSNAQSSNSNEEEVRSTPGPK